MVDQEKLKWIWDNINSIYLKLGTEKYYIAEFKNITILSNDNYFKCRIKTHYGSLVFTIEVEYSLVSYSRYFIHTTNFENVDDIIKTLIPIFRDFKIEMICD